MKNIELKAKLADRCAADRIADGLVGGESPEHLVQEDTYFRVLEGRLKLREVGADGTGAELIFYRRADEAGPKPCEYSRLPVASPAQLKRMLADALGIMAVVRKKRSVYLYRNARVHLDSVEGLGDFIELEVVIPEGGSEAAAGAFARELMSRFSIAPDDLALGSYCDLLVGRS